jgi:aspartate carbamoyltransferase catalytic subunit
MPLPFNHLISSKQLTKEAVEELFSVADDMELVWASGSRSGLLQEKVIALLFY